MAVGRSNATTTTCSPCNLCRVESDALRRAQLKARELADLWNLKLEDILSGSTCSVVYAVGDDQVLKVPFDTAEEASSWPASLAFANHGCVDVLRHDEATGALLMPRIIPGTTLNESELTDLEQVDVCADLILKFRHAPVVETMSLDRWYEELYGMPNTALVIEAQAVHKSMGPSHRKNVLLHGDFHHFNILRSAQGWVGIDPKGIIGDPCFEVVGFMRNPIGRTPGVDGMRARLQRFADRLGDPIERLWSWSFTQTVMCSGSPGGFGNACEEAAKAIWDARPTG